MYGILFYTKRERVSLLLPSKFIINVIFVSLDENLTQISNQLWYFICQLDLRNYSFTDELNVS